MDSPSITQLPVEIVEEILLILSQTGLLLCQSVCRQWHSLITTFPALLRKLFLVPGTVVNGQVQVNRLLEQVFPPFVFTKQSVSARWNSLLPPVGVQWIKSLPWYKSEVRRATVLRKEASWRRMYLAHPAPRLGDTMALDIVGNNTVRTFVGEIADQHAHMCEGGVQMGLLFDIAVHMVDSVLWGGDFSVHWQMVDFGLVVNRGIVIEGMDPVLVIRLCAERRSIVWDPANLSARRSGLHVARLTPGFITFRGVGDVPRHRRYSFSS